MDDQNIGVKSMSEARAVVNLLTHSLVEQRLTLNAGKTEFLTPDEVLKVFHLDTNHALTSWWKRWKKATKANTKQKLRRELKRIWDDAENKDTGHWDKVLKRFYSCVAVTGDSW